MWLELVGHVELARDARVVKIVLRVLIDVGGNVFQRVIVRVYGPDDFIQRVQQFPRGVGDGVDLLADFTLGPVIALRVFAEEGDAAEFRPHFIVQILRDAMALLLEGALLFKLFHPPLHWVIR